MRIKRTVGHPTDLGTLHCVPNSDALLVVAPGLGVVGQGICKRPRTNVIDRDMGQTDEMSQLVVGEHGFGGNRGPATNKAIVTSMVAAVGHAQARQIRELTVHRWVVIVLSRCGVMANAAGEHEDRKIVTLVRSVQHGILQELRVIRF